MSLLHNILLEYQIKSNEKKSFEYIRKIQKKKLQKVITFSYKTTSYYKNLLDSIGMNIDAPITLEELKNIPVLTKEKLIASGETIFSCKYQKNSCYKHITSGSTGKALVLYNSPKFSLYPYLSYDRARRMAGYNNKKHKLLNIGGEPNKIDKNNFLRRILRGIAIDCVDITTEWCKQKEILIHSNYQYLYGYPSALFMLTQKMPELQINKCKAIFSVSEVLTQSTRETIEKTMETEVYDIYGSHEMGCIAWECGEHNGYHINSDYLIPLIKLPNGDLQEYGTGELIITSLNCDILPLINYNQGDIVTLSKEFCKCGSPYPLITDIRGRSNDFIILNDKKIQPLTFVLIMNRIADGIKEYQVIQEDLTLIIFNIVCVDTLFDSISHSIRENFAEIIPENVTLDIQKVVSIQKTIQGKLTSVISKVGEK